MFSPLFFEIPFPMNPKQMPLVHKPNNPLPDDLLLTLLTIDSITRVLGLKRCIDNIHMMMTMLAIHPLMILILHLRRNDKVINIGVGSINVGINLQRIVLCLLCRFRLV